MSKIQIKDKETFVNAIKNAGGYNSVASMVGCSQAMLSLIAKGVRNPNPVVAINFCVATGEKFDTIFL